MICNLTDLKMHLISCGAKFSDDWIRDIEESLNLYTLQSDLNNKEYTVEYDGMIGNIIGHYTTREGRKGVVLQQVGTKIVHVYNEQRIVERKSE